MTQSLIEFFAKNIHDVEWGKYDEYLEASALICHDTRSVCHQFRNEINYNFQKTGLLYELNTNLQVKRIIENSPLAPEVETAINSVKELGVRDLLNEAKLLHRSPHPKDKRDATEKLWDAFERLKTYYSTMDKKSSASKIASDMSGGQSVYGDLFNEEFHKLTDIGNKFRIRHHETDKEEITDVRYYDYFFSRCLSLIAIAIQYLE